MKKSDLKVLRNGGLKSISVYGVRIRLVNSSVFVDIQYYFDKAKAESYCNDILSRNKDIESCFVVEREVFL